LTSRPGLEAGEVGYIATGLKDIKIAKVGDTITEAISNQLSAISYKKLSLFQNFEKKRTFFLDQYPVLC